MTADFMTDDRANMQNHQANTLVHPKSRALCNGSSSLLLLRKTKKSPDNKKRNKQYGHRYIKGIYCTFQQRKSVKKIHIKATEQRP